MPRTPEPALDRRSARSRELLLGALISLMRERGYERLTTQNLIDRAGVGRATFYAHFQNKEELLAASIAGLRAWLVAMREREPGVRFAFMLPFFEHIRSHHDMYRTTFERESEVSVERHIRAMLRELVREDLAAHRAPRQDEGAIELATQFVVSALWAVITWWMDGGAKQPAAEMHAVFRRLAAPGLALTLESAAKGG
jgi:AcrR family transcriptional regulator